jgi:His/Glu/Gln/Arg/opine family amino acid ABC transporter permease subunit
MDFSLIGANIIKLLEKYWYVYLVEGVTTTLVFTCIAVALGVVLGTIVAMLKMSKYKIVRFLVSIYIEVIRGTPILLQLYIFYFVLPEVLPFLNLSQFMWVAIAMCVNSGAYVSEVIRSGIQAVDKGQTEAARSLGMSKSQTMMKIILPQAVRNILPALGNEFIMILKETSLASTFFLGDLMTSHKTVAGATYLQLESLFIVGCIYLCITFPLSKLVALFEKRMSTEKSYKNHKRTKMRQLRSEKGVF